MGQKVKFEKTKVQIIEAIQFDGNNFQEILDFTATEGLYLNLSERNKPLITVWLDGQGNRVMSKDAWLLRQDGEIEIVEEDVIKQLIDGYRGWELIETNE